MPQSKQLRREGTTARHHVDPVNLALPWLLTASINKGPERISSFGAGRRSCFNNNEIICSNGSVFWCDIFMYSTFDNSKQSIVRAEVIAVDAIWTNHILYMLA